MNNPLDKLPFAQVSNVQNVNQNIQYQYTNAMKNPQAFVQHMARTNPQAYQKAMEISKMGNPKQAVMQMLQARGLSPSMFNLPGIN